MSILVFNAGSSSLKFGLFSDPACALLISGSIDWAGGDRHRALLALCKAEETTAQSRTVDVPDDPAAVQCAIQALAETGPDGRPSLAEIRVVGHRVVHGGADFCESVLIDSTVKRGIARWSELAPLHNPPALAAISAAEAALPQRGKWRSSIRPSSRSFRPGRTYIPCPTHGMPIGASAASVFTALATDTVPVGRPRSSVASRPDCGLSTATSAAAARLRPSAAAPPSP